MPLIVRLFRQGRPRAQRTVPDETDIVAAIDDMWAALHLARDDSAAVRFEDSTGSGAWMLISGRDENQTGLEHLPASNKKSQRKKDRL